MILLLILSAIGFLLSLWIVIPAPIFSLLPLSVGAPEISPLLVGLNAPIALLCSLCLWRSLQNSQWKAKLGKQKSAKKLRVSWIVLALSSIALILSLVPLIQLPKAIQSTESAIAKAIGSNYLTQIPDRVQMRSHPFSFIDLLRGISSPPTRLTSGIQFTAPDQVPLTLNIYRPAQVGIYPAIVIVHGGAWQGGSAADYADFSHYMAAKGYVVWSISYRLAPRYTFPTQLEDVQTALKFIQQNARKYETDSTRIAIMGRSAGAHLAMLAAYSDNPPIAFRAVVNYYGPIDLLAGYYDLPTPDPIDSRTMLKTFLGGTPDQFGDRYRFASPINLANGQKQPSLLLYGGKDRIVMAKFGREMSRRLQSAGTQAAFVEIPWADHAFDTVFQGLSNQFALYYTERFLGWALR
jgi:acetyl esterase/lipase